MNKLNKKQLVVCWILSLLISFFIFAPAIKVDTFYKYESEDNWTWKGWLSRSNELKDEEGKSYRISDKDSDGTEGRRYYYAGTYDEYSLNRGNIKNPTYAYERMIIIIIINGLLLIYTLGTEKPSKKSDNTV